ncbi:MAG: hypothetical protein ACJAUQ_000501 [Maribacter sp.]
MVPSGIWYTLFRFPNYNAILVLSAIKQIQDFDIFKGKYKDNLVSCTKSKTRLLRLQQMSIALSFIMMFLIIPTTTKIFDDKDVFLIPLKASQWIGFLIVIVAALFFSR